MAVKLVNDFQQIIIQKSPLIDVRAPVEFQAGSLPGALNLPLMNDEERHLVGICHKQKGGDAALELGKELVAGDIREKREQSWLTKIKENPESVLYCFRGGRRSEIVQQWIEERSGIDIPRVKGGYKSFRNYLLARLDPAAVSSLSIVLGGRTGSGKTILLNQLQNSVDLEALANHRGSSFGRFITSQPTQADFENRLAAALIRHEERNYSHIIVEDEGRHVGRCYLPRGLSDFFSDGKLVVLDTQLAERVQITYDEYVIGGQHSFCEKFGVESGLAGWYEAMEENGNRIVKRLGEERLARLKEMLGAAQQEQRASGAPFMHKCWVEMLITEYYDPMYDYQLKKDNRDVIFRGDSESVLEYLKACC